MEYSVHEDVKHVHSVSPAALAADTNGASIDTLDFEALEFLVHVGTAFVGGGFDISLEESDTGAFAGEENAVVTGDLVGDAALTSGRGVVVAIGDTAKTYRLGYVGKKRFVRPVLTETGTITGGVIGVSAILARPKSAPVDDQNT